MDRLYEYGIMVKPFDNIRRVGDGEGLAAEMTNCHACFFPFPHEHNVAPRYLLMGFCNRCMIETPIVLPEWEDAWWTERMH